MARILVVDDHEDSRELAAFILATAGHQTVQAADGDEALAALKREPIDLAVIDIFMPVKDGIEVIREIRRDFPAIKIVAVSAGWRPPIGGGSRWNFEMLAKAREVGAEGALPKPLTKEALLALVEGLTDPAA
jgi:CheY-like chemotaxis protein